MHDRRDVMLREGARKGRAVEEIPLHDRAGDKAAMTGRKIVVDDRLVTGRSQRPATMRSDIAGAAGDENSWAIAHARTRHCGCNSMVSRSPDKIPQPIYRLAKPTSIDLF